MDEWDYIIVGGGSAGSVMANRLSAKASNRVLVIEAGPDTPHGDIPPEIHSSYPGVAYFDQRFHWTELKVTTQPKRHNDPSFERPKRSYEQARIMGGGSSINGQLLNRGAPTDFDGWRDMGVAGWGWDDVLPFFKKLERDLDFPESDWHGDAGRITVRRLFEEQWTGHSHASKQALLNEGYEYITDQNGAFRDGFFPLTISNAFDRRVSAAIGYLDPPTRRRENLTIIAETRVAEITFDGLKATGVTAAGKGGELKTYKAAKEVIICSGALHSPAHLLRAGIGPEGHLRDMGIEVRHALPGVGQNLQDHPSVSVSGYLPSEHRLQKDDARHMHLGWRFSSNMHDAPAGDMFAAQVAKSAWHDLGKRLGSFLVWVNRTYSTGEVQLASKDWRDEPAVDFGLCSDRRDVDRLADGFRRCAALMMSEAMADVAKNPFPTAYTEQVRKIAKVNGRNKAITWMMGKMMDGPEPLRKMLIEKVVTGGVTLRQLMEDDEALDSFVIANATGTWHATCSCRMGGDDDPMAVTDNQGRVRGVAGLRVVDASIFPTVPCANTNGPTMMAAEKIADAIASA
jgi:5-(hydroxymethyl)furfural/furfural oxidase